MAFRSLFVPAQDPQSLAAALDDSVHLLEERGVLDARFVWTDYAPPAGMASAYALTEVTEQQRRAVRKLETDLQEAFDQGSQRLPGSFTMRFRAEAGDFRTALARASRMSDAILFHHRGEKHRLVDPPTIEEMIFRSGRPMVLVPEGGLHGPLRHIAVAWNGSREAARALALAEPLVRHAAKVTFLAIGDPHPDTPSADELARHFSDSGAQADALIRDKKGRTSEMLADMAGSVGADAMVLGAYSHARLREIVLGGVTRRMLDDPPLPLVVAH